MLIDWWVKKKYIMARKSGKLPGKCLSVTYATEYSIDQIEMIDGLVAKGENVLLVDDLIATGGSLEACKRLVNQAGGNVVGCLVMLKVDELFESAKLLVGCPIHVVFED